MNNKFPALLLTALTSITVSSANAENTGNRYGYPVLYHSEISSARAWLDVSKGQSRESEDDDHERADSEHYRKKPVILDVRRIEEYVAGHPIGAYSIPFPHVTKSPLSANDNRSGYIGYDISVDPEVGFLLDQTAKDGTLPIQSFVDYVESLFPDKDQPLYLLCATGHRSVQAANALAKYGHYTNVKNIWEGYNGQPKYAYTGNIPTQPLVALDLNNDGLVNGDDRDGWAFFQGLPTETKLNKHLLFKPNLSLYPKRSKK